MKFTKDTLKRVLKTFLQSAVAYAVVAVAAYDFTEADEWRTVVVGICVSAVAAGLAAVMNLHKDEGETDGLKYVHTEENDDKENDDDEGVG